MVTYSCAQRTGNSLANYFEHNCGRCIRFEPGKQAEIFTLVIKGTVEEKWYEKSMEGLEYIEINESELDKILNNEKLKNKKKIKQEVIQDNITSKNERI